MDRRHLTVCALALVATPLVCVYAGCGDDGQPTAGAAPGVGAPTSPPPPGSSLPGSRTDPGPSVCEGTLQRGEEIAESAATGAPPPPLGGTIVGGTYVLVDAKAYGAPEPPPSDEPPEVVSRTGVKIKKTLFVAGNVMRAIGARSAPGGALPADIAEAWTFSPGASSMDAGPKALDTKAVCPTKGTTVKQVQYSAVGNSLALFVDATHREVYQRR